MCRQLCFAHIHGLEKAESVNAVKSCFNIEIFFVKSCEGKKGQAKINNKDNKKSRW